MNLIHNICPEIILKKRLPHLIFVAADDLAETYTEAENDNFRWRQIHQHDISVLLYAGTVLVKFE